MEIKSNFVYTWEREKLEEYERTYTDGQWGHTILQPKNYKRWLDKVIL